MKRILPFLILFGLFSCQAIEKAANNETYFFVTTLGSDTLAVEQITLTADAITSTVLLRSPRLTIQEASLEFNRDGLMENFAREVIDPLTDSILLTEEAYWQEDSLLVRRARNGQEQSKNVSSNKSITPFIDMVHWPFELMIHRGYTSSTVIQQPVFNGTRTFDFEITKISPDSMAVRHPSRGVMGVIPTTDGTLDFLEAKRTTRALVVRRTSNLDMDDLLDKFIEQDMNNPFGQLSGRGSFETSIKAVDYSLDYGTPAMRGREIWGGLVPYGKRWRTGANKASHFTTSEDINLGGLHVPAGEYTLYTIPEASGGVLIINKQTGQNGQRYDEDQDLGQVPMEVITLEEPVEVFEILVASYEDGHALMLQWDRQAFAVRIK